TSYYASTCPFDDVSGSYSWARGPVGAAYASKVVSGRTATTYDPAATVTAVEAAAMIMRGLGYFKYAEDYADGFNLAIVRQANQIGLFTGIEGDASTPMTRNQVAQLALNALRSNVVDFTGTPGIEIDGVKVGYKGEYTPRTGTEAKYNAIAGLTTTLGKDESRYYVQLGEELYGGDLKLYDTYNDEFGRPARYWEYDGKDIGTYAKYELMRKEYTTAIDGRDLTDLLGKFVIENNDVDYYLNGKVDTTIEAKTMVKANTKDYATTGNGVLTQVFFENGAKNTNGQITIVSIDTFLAKATGDYNEKKETLSVDIWADDSAAASVGSDSEIKLDEIASIENVKKDDKFLVQVAWDGKTYQIVNKLDVDSQVDVKLNKYSENSYLANADGQYDYALTGKLVDSLNEIAQYNNKALVDYTYDLYFDQYGYLIGNAVHSGEKHYVFIAGYDLDGSHLATAEAKASAIFLDGTMKNIQVAVKDTNTNIAAYNTKSAAGGTSKNWYPEFGKSASATGGLDQYNAWFTYTTDSKTDVYTLTPAENWMEVEAPDADPVTNGAPTRIRTANMVLKQTFGLKGNTSATTGVAGTRAYGNDDSVYITVDTGDVSSGSSKIGITEVTGVYTGVQNVDLDIWITGTTDETNQLAAKDTNTHMNAGGTATNWGWNTNTKKSGVFAVYDDDLYIIGAVVVGEDNTSSNDYAYVLKKVKNEYIDNDNNHYWDFDAVVDGQIKTLTAKVGSAKYTAMSTVFTALCGTVGSNGLAQITYDKDGYVTNLVQMQDKVTATANNVAKVYGNMDYTTDINPDVQKVYSVQYQTGGTSAETGCDKEPTTGNFTQIGRSLYNATVSEDGTSYDAGLPLATGAPVIVVRGERYTGGGSEIVYEDYNSIEQALNALDDHKTNFEGWVSAVLDGTGAAKFIVINDKNFYTITNDDGPVSSGKIQGTELVETGLTPRNTTNDGKYVSAIKSLKDGLYQSDYMISTWAATDPDDVLIVKFTAPAAVANATVSIRGNNGKLWYTETQSVTANAPNFFSIHVSNGNGHYHANAWGPLTVAGAGNLPRGTYEASVSCGAYSESWTFTVD
ncbi:S-layer homology domain-containing protein, partial [Oscillospiraceae bacterium 50-58]